MRTGCFYDGEWACESIAGMSLEVDVERSKGCRWTAVLEEEENDEARSRKYI